MGRDAWHLIVAAAALIPASAACGFEVDFSARFRCASSAECPAGYECSAGYCAAPPEGGGAAAADAAPGELAASADARPAAELLVLFPVADAYVDAAQPEANRGTGDELRADGFPAVTSYLDFDQPALDAIEQRDDIESVRLELYARAAHATGYRVSLVDDAWSESGLTFANAPPIGIDVGSSGPIAAGTWTSVELGGSPVGDLESFAITTDSETALNLASREAGDLAPRLVFAVAAD
ncbi:MAG TPA: DNRLRE domain-containing protein [Kofleriaceae bacterium]|nr:DNRLRE domain-containing protein [Kofleriaceae bacterium]